MQSHTFSPTLFSRIQKHAIPLVDSIEDVINRALDHMEGADTLNQGNDLVKTENTNKEFDAFSMPDLTHTTLLSMSVAGIPLLKGVSWNKLMERAICAAAEKGWSAEKLMNIMEVPASVGASQNYSYTYLPDAGLSVQGQNSNRAWKQAVRLAKEAGFKLEVSWMWQYKDKSYLPGVVGLSTVNLGH